mgnify:CR=1 FL=1
MEMVVIGLATLTFVAFVVIGFARPRDHRGRGER